MQTKALPGFRDFYPADLALRAHIFQTWRTVVTRYGFEEYDGPPLEPLDLYTAKSGDEIVGQLYNFTDKGDRQVALRPEMTPTLARMVAARANGLKKPIRWFSIPQLFRYERQQRGRLREHFQLNCDLIGEAGPLADAEMMALAVDVMREFKLGPDDIRLRVSDRQILNILLLDAGVTQAQLPAAYAAVDKFERLEWEVTSRPLEEAGASKAVIKEVQKIAGYVEPDNVMSYLQRIKGPLREEALIAGARLKETLDAIDKMELGGFVDVELRIVRGLAYYTGMVFELFDKALSFRAIAGGGRYDNLLQGIGGVDLPALGFGMGDVVLAELLKEKGLVPADASSVDVFLAFITPEDLPHVLELAHQLRHAGLRVEYALSPQAVGKQLKLADARNARLAVMLGPDERARGELVLKDLRGKAQETVSQGSAVDTIKARLHG